MDDIQVRIVFLLIGLIIGYIAGAATSAVKYARTAKIEIHECMTILNAIKTKIEE